MLIGKELEKHWKQTFTFMNEIYDYGDYVVFHDQLSPLFHFDIV